MMELDNVAVGTIILVSLVVLATLVLSVILGYARTENGKPPHPPSWPLIGHLHLLRKKKPMHRILAQLSQRYGPIMHLQLGFRSVLVISSSDLAKECFTTNDKALASRPQTAAAKHLGYNYKMFTGLPYDSYLRNLRKFCNVEILSPKRIDSFKHVRAEEVCALIRSLFQSCAEPINMKSRLSDLTSNIVVRIVFGRRVSGYHNLEDFKEGQELKKFLEETFLLFGTFAVGDYLPFLKWLDLRGVISAMKKVHRKRDAFIQKLVDEHRKDQGMHAQARDFIDLLISAIDNHEIPSDNNDDVVKATALNLVTAGTDTSSVTIEWALASLLQHPDILRKAQEELDKHVGRERAVEESDLQELSYLQAIVKETFRLYPAGPLLVPHEAAEECSIGGFHVPVGTRVLVNAWAIQRDQAVWSNPMEFNPERFLNGGKVIDVKGQDFELIPFGSGRRMCPGMYLGLVVVQYALARLLQSFTWSLPEGVDIDMDEGLGISMPKGVPLVAIAKPRMPLHLY